MQGDEVAFGTGVRNLIDPDGNSLTRNHIGDSADRQYLSGADLASSSLTGPVPEEVLDSP